MRRHLIIPDTQVTPDTPVDHLRWIGQYILESRPDVIVQIGDFADMESLSSWDKGKKSFEGRRYLKDIKAANDAMEVMMSPLQEHNARKRSYKSAQYLPEMHLTLGNHEARITRACEDNAELDGILSLDHLNYADYGWKVHPFLKPVTIDGVAYAHYFANPQSGRPYSGESIATRLKNVGFSFTMGHQQVHMVGVRPLNNGTRIRGLVSGSCYLHDEDYRGHQANGEWRGIIVKNEVRDGDYDLMEVSLDYLCRRYEGVLLHDFMREQYPDIYQGSHWMQARRAA